MFPRSSIRAVANCLPRFLNTNSTGQVAQPVKQKYFYKDKRIGERRRFGEPLTLKDGRTIQFEIADEKDEDLFLNQYLDGFVNQIGFMRAFGVTRGDYYDIFEEEAKTVLPHGGTMFGFHEDKLVCFRFVTFHKHGELAEKFGPLSKPNDPPPVAHFPKDFGHLVDAMPYDSFMPKFSAVLLPMIETQIGKFFPPDVQNVAYSGGFFVHDAFQRNGIAEHLCNESDKLAIERGCNYIANITVVTASTMMARKRGYRTLFHIPYDEVYVHGERKFQNLYDKSDGWSANLKKLY